MAKFGTDAGLGAFASFLPYDYLRQPRRTWFVDESGNAAASASGQQQQQLAPGSNLSPSGGTAQPGSALPATGPTTGPPAPNKHLSPPTATMGVREGAVRIDEQPLADLTTRSMSATSLASAAGGPGASGGVGSSGLPSTSRSPSALSRTSGDVEMTQVRDATNGGYGPSASGGVKSLPLPPTPSSLTRPSDDTGIAR